MYNSFRRTLLVRERDDLRSDIDNLKERVANLEASIEPDEYGHQQPTKQDG